MTQLFLSFSPQTFFVTSNIATNIKSIFLQIVHFDNKYNEAVHFEFLLLTLKVTYIKNFNWNQPIFLKNC